jgi:hypothetical protein
MTKNWKNKLKALVECPNLWTLGGNLIMLKCIASVFTSLYVRGLAVFE